MRLPTISAPTRPAIPALMCTTVPPAKSSAPFWNRKPAVASAASPAAASVYASGPAHHQTMCAIGRYAAVNQITMNSSTALNLMRSANAPTIRHGVMQANVSWKMNQVYSGR